MSTLKRKVIGKIPSVTVDEQLSDTSTNPVQNKVVKHALDQKVDKNGQKVLSDNNYSNEEKQEVAKVKDKQDKLVSGTNIKTINSQSILGSGNIQIEGGGGNSYTKQESDAKYQPKGNYATEQQLTNKADKTSLQAEVTRATNAEENLRQLYNNLQQSQPIPVTALPATGEAGKIYRLVGTNSYADYMYSENDLTTPIKMAEYNNAIDNELIEGSENLVRNGAVYEEVEKLRRKTSNIDFIPESSSEEIIDVQDDNGNSVMSITPEGATFKKIYTEENGKVILVNEVYGEDNSNDEDVTICDEEGYAAILLSKGHIFTKYFNSKELNERTIPGILNDIEELRSSGMISNKSIRRNNFIEDYYSYKYGKDINKRWFERFRIMHYSDTHTNTTNLSEALWLAQGLVHLVLDTGDNANGLYNTPAQTTINELQEYRDVESDNNTNNMPMAICPGNHDVPNLTKKQYYDILCKIVEKTNPLFVFGDAEHYRTYGYVDLTPNATIGTVRIITLDPFDYDDGQFMNPYGTTGIGGWMNCVFSQKQINWLINILRGAANNGYKVITAMHYSFGDNHTWDNNSANPDANYHQNPFMIPDIIEAMQQKTSLTANYEDDENINNISINEDFTGLTNGLDYICHLFGHIHSENEYQCQTADGSKKYDMLMIGAPNMGSEGYAINKVPLQGDTINSIKCTILEIDTVEKAIYRVNYGAYKAYDKSSISRVDKINYRFI